MWEKSTEPVGRSLDAHDAGLGAVRGTPEYAARRRVAPAIALVSPRPRQRGVGRASFDAGTTRGNMRLARPPFVCLLLVSSAVGCAGGMRTGNGTMDDRSLITREQVQSRHVTTAYDAVRSLRGNWLVERGKSSFNRPVEIQVYVDGVRVGGVAMLKDIASESVQSIRFFSGIEATTRWGTDHGRGAIFVVTEGQAPGAFLPPGAVRPPVAMSGTTPGSAGPASDYGF